MLASPDIDVDVFRRQIAEIDAGPRPAQFTLFISRDDRALGLSSFLARDSTRLGALDPSKEPYRSILEQGRVQVVDLTGMASGDFTQSRQIRQRRSRWRDRRAAGGGSVAQRRQGRPGRIARHVHQWRDQRRGRRRHRRRRCARRGLRSDQAREVGRHRGASHVFEAVIRKRLIDFPSKRPRAPRIAESV